MKLLTLLLCMLALTTAFVIGQTVASNSTKVVSVSDSDAAEKTLVAQSPTVFLPTREFLNVPTHRLSLVYRDKPDGPEMHVDDTDVWIIKSGRGTVVIGGEMVNKRPGNDPVNFRSDSLQGGQRFDAKPGDIFNIPPNVPHQVLLERGQTITYYNLKLRGKPLAATQ